MSFACCARKVLDTSLPLNRRVSALRSCVQSYHPIGFEATFSFLSSAAGSFANDPAALPRALELLTTSRAAWLAELRAYGVLRRRAKQLGYRVPHPSAPNPNRPSHWYGAPREAAFHAVWVWYSKGASADVDVHALAAALVHRGRFTSVQRAMFEEVRADLAARFAAVDGTRDFQTYSELRDSLYVVRQMAVVVGGNG
ncbi:hypothetical protein ABZ345_18650 [Lentzea sp. NPDC005914]|uniref:hypothetical protein n=1 Tax=Lentzea sp. NPDC005914 TaxID=3154572 RepID=UPI0033D1F971